MLLFMLQVGEQGRSGRPCGRGGTYGAAGPRASGQHLQVCLQNGGYMLFRESCCRPDILL